jgi:hypothetical protein
LIFFLVVHLLVVFPFLFDLGFVAGYSPAGFADGWPKDALLQFFIRVVDGGQGSIFPFLHFVGLQELHDFLADLVQLGLECELLSFPIFSLLLELCSLLLDKLGFGHRPHINVVFLGPFAVGLGLAGRHEFDLSICVMVTTLLSVLVGVLARFPSSFGEAG